MTIETFCMVALLVWLPVGCLVLESKGRRALRGILAISAILGSLAVASLNRAFTPMTYNAWYGKATKKLIETTVTQIEDGNLERVLGVFRALNRQYYPTYETRAKYQELVSVAVSRMRGEDDVEAPSRWDPSPFDADTWIGHWENGTGFWIVITPGLSSGGPLEIIRAGSPRTKMDSVNISGDFRVLKCRSHTGMRHTFTLENKYKARHEWFDLGKQKVWQIDFMHKLVRPTYDQRRMAQPNAPGGRLNR